MKSRATSGRSVGTGFLPAPASTLPDQVAALFTSSSVGGVADPADLSTMWQDVARTTPVTGPDQQVASIKLKFGAAAYAEQATLAKRPYLRLDPTGRYYLSFDGVDDWMQTDVALNLNTALLAFGLECDTVGSVMLSTGSAGYLRRGGGDAGLTTFWVRNNGGPAPASTLPIKGRQSVAALVVEGNTVTNWSDSTGATGTNSVTAGSAGLSGRQVIGAFSTGGELPQRMRLYSAVLRAGAPASADVQTVLAFNAWKMGGNVSP